MCLQWSRHQFEQEATSLVQAFQGIDDDQRGLNRWTVAQHPSDSTVYLEHPSVCHEMMLPDCNAGDKEETRTHQEEEDHLCDESILQDDPDEVAMAMKTTNSTTILMHWHFSIVYSDTWRVPILYFTVDDSNGNPCSRSQALAHLKQLSATNHVKDSWDFLSIEEHPVSQVPSFFLHPCQTSERMQTLISTVSCHEDLVDNRNKPNLLLLSWMSMILPSVGYPMPSKIFQQILLMQEHDV